MSEDEFDGYLPGPPDTIYWFFTDVQTQAWDLELIAKKIDQVVLTSRIEAIEKHEKQSRAIKEAYLQEAKDRGLGTFNSLDDLNAAIQSGANEEILDDLTTLRAQVANDFNAVICSIGTEHFEGLSEQTTQIVRYGNLQAVQAFLELKLKEVCDLTTCFRKVRIDIKDLAKRGSDLARTQDFLEKVMEIHIDPKHWERLEVFGKVRNCIAHRSGFVDAKRDNWIQNATSQLGENVSIVNGRLELGPEFVVSYLNASVDLFKALTDKLHDWVSLRTI